MFRPEGTGLSVRRCHPPDPSRGPGHDARNMAFALCAFSKPWKWFYSRMRVTTSAWPTWRLTPTKSRDPSNGFPPGTWPDVLTPALDMDMTVVISLLRAQHAPERPRACRWTLWAVGAPPPATTRDFHNRSRASRADGSRAAVKNRTWA